MNQLASFHLPEPRMVVVQPYDKGSMAAIEKAIRNSDLGVNPTNDGTIIRVIFPELSEERRKEFIKVARNKAEDSKVSIRNIRRRKRQGTPSTSWSRPSRSWRGRRPACAERELDELTHTYTGQVDELLKHKEAELLEVLAAVRRGCPPVRRTNKTGSRMLVSSKMSCQTVLRRTELMRTVLRRTW